MGRFKFPKINALRRTVAILSVCLWHYAAGQTAGPTPAADQDVGQKKTNAEGGGELQEVQVTGSRIRTTNLQSISPVTSVSADEIHLTGAVDIEAALRDLMEEFPGRGETTNNNGAGDTSANLRNLGERRTLVLVDGKRMVGSDSRGVVDLDSIPIGMIERIDVMTGGASAVYGADAIAGVVNIILKKNVTGVEASAQYGGYTGGDGKKYDASIIGGLNFADGQGNVTAFAGYTKRDPVLGSDRPWGFPTLISNGTSLVPYSLGVGSVGQDLGAGLMFTRNRTLVPAAGANPLNYTDWSSTQFLVVPQERYSTGLNGHYDFSSGAQFYFRATWSQNQVDRQVLNGTIFEDPVSVNYGNPFLSNQERSVLFSPGPHAASDLASFTLGQIFPQNGNVGEQDTYDAYELVTGITGKIGSHFEYDLSVQYGQSDWHQVLVGDISPSRFQQGLLVNPNGTCTNPANGCVPIDIFTSAAGAITPTQVNFFNLVQQAHSTAEQWITSGTVSGDLAQLGLQTPWAKESASIVLGAEHRNESAEYLPDANLAVGNNILFGAIPPMGGAYHVSEAFFETRIPLVTGQPWAESLQLEGGYRYSDYDLAGTTGTYKYGMVWQPVEDIRLRGAFEHAVRAPGIDELFTPQQAEFTNGVDPCFSNNGAPPTASKALCVATGVPASAYGSPHLQCVETCVVYEGGNPNLSVETSDSRTFGVALMPRFVPGLTLSADYYHIGIDGAISTLATNAQPVLDGCYGTGAGENPTQSPSNIWCEAIQRNPSGAISGGGHNGSLGGILLLNANVGFEGVEGVDSEISYTSRLSDIGFQSIPGRITISTKAAYVESYLLQANSELPTYQCVGTFGNTCGQPIPNWRISTRLTWAPDDDISLSLRWRYISGVILDVDKFTGTISDPPDHEIPSYSYFDISTAWRVTDHLTLRGGVTNLLDKSPPILSVSVASAFNNGFSNTFPATYDISRQLFFGITGRF